MMVGKNLAFILFGVNILTKLESKVYRGIHKFDRQNNIGMDLAKGLYFKNSGEKACRQRRDITAERSFSLSSIARNNRQTTKVQYSKLLKLTIYLYKNFSKKSRFLFCHEKPDIQIGNEYHVKKIESTR
jgi:hypothetical protein